ncbi:MAG TPA: hypothetical protein VIG33_14880 [Pseudobdellovibrionaceae bacterium]|jgi:hypothetical protein
MSKRFLTTKDLMDTYGKSKSEEKPFDSAAFDKFMYYLSAIAAFIFFVYSAVKIVPRLFLMIKGAPAPVDDQFPI